MELAAPGGSGGRGGRDGRDGYDSRGGRSGPASSSSASALDPAFVLRGHRGDVTALAFHPSGRALAAGDSEGELKLWDLAYRRPVLSTQPHSRHAGVLGAAFWGPATLLTQGRDGAVRAWGLLPAGALTEAPLWELPAGGPHTSYNFTRLGLLHAGPVPGDDGGCTGMAAGPVASTALLALSGREPRDICVWDVRSPPTAPALTLAGRAPPTQGEGGGAAAGGAPPVAEDAAEAASAAAAAGAPYAGPCGMAMAVALFDRGGAAGPAVLAGYEDGSLGLWDLRSPRCHVAAARLHREAVLCLAVDASGCGGASGGADGEVVTFALGASGSSGVGGSGSAAAPLDVRARHALRRPGTADVAIRPDLKVLASAHWDHRVRIWDYLKGRPLATLKYHAAALAAVAFAPAPAWGAAGGGERPPPLLASAGRDGTVALWEIYPPGAATCT